MKKILIFVFLFCGLMQVRGNKIKSVFRDPFKPEKIKSANLQVTSILKEEKPQFSLTGIVIDGNKSYAIVNDSIVKKNTMIEEYSVKNITKNHVTLEKNGKTYHIFFKISKNEEEYE